MSNRIVKLASALALLAAGPAAAAQVPEVLDDCAGCHQLQPEPGQADLASRTERTAPPLHYAGNKFREDWLVQWLQTPVRLRPAGDYPPAHTRTDGDVDVLDAGSLVDHPMLAADQAQAAASWLMQQRPLDHLIDAEADYEPGTVNPRMGAMDFVKFKGCGACHKDTPEYGGVSAPELYTAWQRLQPEFIVSYIRDPSAWEPYSLMPNKELNDGNIHKLANYLRTIGEEEE